MPIVLLVDGHIVLRRLHVVGLVAFILGEPCGVEAHRDVGDVQVLRFLWAHWPPAITSKLPLRELHALPKGLLRPVGVALQAPQGAEVVPHLRHGDAPRRGLALLQQLRDLLVDLDADLLRSTQRLRSRQLVVRLGAHGPSLHVLFVLGDEGVGTFDSFGGLVAELQISESEQLQHLDHTASAFPDALQGRYGLVVVALLDARLSEAIEAREVFGHEVRAALVVLLGLGEAALGVREAAELVVDFGFDAHGHRRQQRALQQLRGQVPRVLLTGNCKVCGALLLQGLPLQAAIEGVVREVAKHHGMALVDLSRIAKVIQ
mmetsp:Transcript_110720/g.318255  ORF Transcript_110720/g.318255 Transcript_110720/m.318255 type:complete len:318 (-) Transcript_110720:94-1047(-)